MEKPIVYICSPYAGDAGTNTDRAKRYGLFAALQMVVPVVPHLMYPQFLSEDDPRDRRIGLDFSLRLLDRCDEVWVFGDRVSSGMAGEIARAQDLRLPIRYFDIHCKEYDNALEA